MKLKLTYLKTADLLPYAGNSRTHSDEQVNQIAASIKEFGFAAPVCVAEGTILAGHGRVMAARRLGMKEVPTVDLSHLTPAQRRQYVVADNKLAMNAGWDEDVLAAEIALMKEEGSGLDVLGFTAEELAEIENAGTEGQTDPDETPEPPAQPVSVLGDVWVMGGHRIICGSSTEAHTVEKVLAGAKPHLMVTDPPYGVEYDASWRSKAMPKKNDSGRWTDNDGRAKGVVLNDDRADWREAWALFTGDVAYVWHGSLQTSIVVDSFEHVGLKPRSLIVWAKSHFAIGRGDYHPMHEPCWYFVREGKTGHWAGDRKQTTLWEIDKPQKSETGHSTQKPIECMKRPIENNSVAGDHIYEPFSGSGTTIIAGEMTGRHVHAIELNHAYVDIAVTRWQNFTGKQATNEATGKTFDETKAKMEGAKK